MKSKLNEIDRLIDLCYLHKKTLRSLILITNINIQKIINLKESVSKKINSLDNSIKLIK